MPAPVLGEEPHHIGDDNQVQDQRGEPEPGDVAGQFIELDRHINPATEGGEPFGPAPFMPEAVALREADSGVKRKEYRHGHQLRVARLRHGLDENLGVMPGRVDVQVAEDLLGKDLVVAIQEAQGDESGDEGSRSFDGFKEGDGTEGFVGGGGQGAVEDKYECSGGKKKAARLRGKR